MEANTTAKEQAAALLSELESGAQRKAALVESLIAQRKSIDEALVALGVKRVRERKSKIGRPKGSRNKPAPQMAEGRNAAQVAGL